MRSVADETKPKGIALMRKSGRKIRKESVLPCNEIIHQSHHRRHKGKSKPKRRPTCAERQRVEEEEDQGLNKLWLVIRSMNVDDKENHFVLRGGERIKIGRVVFTVRELANEKYRYCCEGSPRLETENGGHESSLEFHSSASADGQGEESLLSCTDDGEFFYDSSDMAQKQSLLNVSKGTFNLDFSVF